MLEIKLNENEFDACIEYCKDQRDYGSFKYLYEISVPQEELGEFLSWLQKCEKAELTFFFMLLERYDAHKLLYGFSNFEIKETPNMKFFDFSFQNNDVLHNRFKLWSEECSSCIMPKAFYLLIKILSAPSKDKNFRVVENTKNTDE